MNTESNKAIKYLKNVIQYESLSIPGEASINDTIKILEIYSKMENGIRHYLWLNHGNNCCPYGDDGERQCCGIDFNRTDIKAIIEIIYKKRKNKAFEG